MISFVNRDYADKRFLKMSVRNAKGMMGRFSLGSLVFVGLMVLAGCSSVPSTNVHQPMSVRPAPQPDRQAANGAIYQAGVANRPLFEDRRARNVGDILTISIVESTSASKNDSTKASRAGSVDVTSTAPTVMGFTPSPGGLGVATVAGLAGSNFSGQMGNNFNTSVTGSGTHTFEGKGDTSQKNAFSGTITVTVIEVFANGNLLVSGEKQMGLNEGSEFVRFSGVVNPVNITSANTVLSTSVADARLELKGKGELSSAQMMGWLTKFFLTVLPF